MHHKSKGSAAFPAEHVPTWEEFLYFFGAFHHTIGYTQAGPAAPLGAVMSFRQDPEGNSLRELHEEPAPPPALRGGSPDPRA